MTAYGSTLCTSIANSTKMILSKWAQRGINTLVSVISQDRNRFPLLARIDSLKTGDLLYGDDKRADDPAYFFQMITEATTLASKNEFKKCHIRVADTDGVLIIDPKDLQEIKEEHKDDLESHESVPIFDHYFKGTAAMSFPSHDPEWMKHRGPIKNTAAQLHDTPKCIIELAKQYVEKLKEEKAQDFNLKELANSFTLDVILKGFLGADETTHELRLQLTEMVSQGIDEVVKLRNIAWLTIEAIIPALYRANLPSDAILEQAQTLIKQIIITNKNNIIKNKASWITKKIPAIADTEIKDFDVPDKVSNEIAFLLTAGSETTAKHFQFTFMEVLQNPQVLAKLIEEIEALGDVSEWKTETFSQEKTPYLHAIILESLRLHPPLPLQKVKVRKAFTLQDGTAFQPGDHVFVNVGAIHKNAFSDRPEQFLPERFLKPAEKNESKKDTLNHDFVKIISMANPLGNFLAFGKGQRSCPGAPLATMEVMVALACFLKTFTLKMAPWNGKVITTFSSRPEDVAPIKIEAVRMRK